MKAALLILLFYCPFLQAQSYPVGNPTEWMTNKATVKIMLISAEWCTYCRETRALFEQSRALHPTDSLQLAYFEFPENWPDTFSFQGEAYGYFASGPDQGRHAFVDFLLSQAEMQSFPLLLLWDSREEQFALYSGMLSESDWSSLLDAILNQRAVPDSVSNN